MFLVMRTTRSADAQARVYTEEAIQTLASIMTNELEEPKNRIRAAETLLDRGHGKAVSAVIQIPASKAQAAMLAAMTDEELLMVVKSEELPRLTAPKSAPPTLEGQFSVAWENDPLLD